MRLLIFRSGFFVGTFSFIHSFSNYRARKAPLKIDYSKLLYYFYCNIVLSLRSTNLLRFPNSYTLLKQLNIPKKSWRQQSRPQRIGSTSISWSTLNPLTAYFITMVNVFTGVCLVISSTLYPNVISLVLEI